MRFSLLALFLVCATLATVNGNKFKWFKSDNAEDCKNVDENDSSLEKDDKPSSKDCDKDGSRFCFCAKIKDDWHHKCAVCQENDKFSLKVEKSPCEDESHPSCDGASPICKDGSKVNKHGQPCPEGQGPPRCEDKNLKPLCADGQEPARRPPGNHKGVRR